MKSLAGSAVDVQHELAGLVDRGDFLRNEFIRAGTTPCGVAVEFAKIERCSSRDHIIIMVIWNTTKPQMLLQSLRSEINADDDDRWPDAVAVSMEDHIEIELSRTLVESDRELSTAVRPFALAQLGR